LGVGERGVACRQRQDGGCGKHEDCTIVRHRLVPFGSR
jgi:hypothetical protein